MGRGEIRADIQALRGFAVLIVVLYHARLSLLPSGYLGVDVFFVISGFLITRLIKNGIERGDFHFSAFYIRRALRLLPAAYVTLLFTTLLAPFFLDGPELSDLRAQIIGTVTFTGNFVLWRQSGYFSGTADLKPLLHVWSLAIEEQYYFLLPAVLVIVPRRWWMPLITLTLAGSLVLCLLLAGRDLAFYLLPTRSWELLVGSVGALLAPSPRRDQLLRLLFWPALAVLLGLPFLSFSAPHPGAAAMLICSATLIVILRNHPQLNALPAIRPFRKLGDISYSLYLVHWPAFAFFNNTWMSKPGDEEPLLARIGLVLISLFLAELLHRYVEEPVRYANIQRKLSVLMRTLATSCGIILLNAGVAHAVTEVRGSESERRFNYGFSQNCIPEVSAFNPARECSNSDRPALMVWGDSFAMHLVPGLAYGTPHAELVQATRPACGPFLDVALIRESAGRTRSWAESCIAFNRSVIDYLRAHESIRIVVLSSPLDYLLNPKDRLLKRVGEGEYVLADTGQDEAIAALRHSVQALRSMGKRVVMVAPPPMSGLDVGRCQQRLQHKLPVLGASRTCDIEMTAYQRERGAVLKLLEALPDGADTTVIRFDSLLCDSKVCRTAIDGVRLYNDRGHLSEDGITYLAAQTALLDNIERHAR